MKVADIGVTDDALGSNVVTLTGADASSFEVFSGGLYLKAGESLNYEAKQQYAVTVNVGDASVANSTAVSTSYTLNLTDVNDNTPSFNSSSTGTVAENGATTTVIYQASASDADSTNVNNVVSYSLKSGLTDDAAALNINTATGAVTLKESADYETKASYSFTVVATDNGSSALSSEKAVTVNVTDVDESDVTTPMDSNVGANTVAENASTGTLVGVTASASDADGTSNTVTYSLVSASDGAYTAGEFTVSSTSGVVTVLGTIDREAGATRTIYVKATSADTSTCLLYTSPSPRDRQKSRMPSSA